MRTNIKTFIATLLSLSVGLANAAALDPAHYPSDLIFLGKPIDPLCLDNHFGSDADNVDLKTCGIIQEKYNVLHSEDDLFFIKGNYYGFDWKETVYNSQGRSYYKVWDAGDHEYWVLTINNGGGSGTFRTLNLYSRKSFSTVNLIMLAAGDRCNGGIYDVEEKKHGVQYNVAITPDDFLAIAEYNPHNLQPYDDLAACASCCAAVAYYQVDKKLDSKLVYVDLDNKELNLPKLPDYQGKYQDCFNKMISSYISKGKTKLNLKQLKQFAKEFNKSCVAP